MEACTPDGKILKRKNKEKNLKSQWVLEHPLSEFAKEKRKGKKSNILRQPIRCIEACTPGGKK